MMQVDMIYRDSSIGNLMHINLVKFVLLKEKESFGSTKNESSVSAPGVLSSFCKWQKSLNQFHDYDIALLLTRQVLRIINMFSETTKLIIFMFQGKYLPPPGMARP